MGRYNDNAPIGHTCPKIDAVISYLKSIKFDSALDVYELNLEESERDEVIELMEVIRAANSTLRDWGNQECKEKEEFEEERDELAKEVEELKQRMLEDLFTYGITGGFRERTKEELEQSRCKAYEYLIP
jgi:hypothetical protein